MVVERIQEFGIQTLVDGEGFQSRVDHVATEEPLEIRIDGVPLAVVMRTPGDDIELAAGFLCAEEILRDTEDVGTIAHCRSGTDPDLENVVNVLLSSERKGSAEAMLAQRKAERSTVTSASCGVCGKRTIESLRASVGPFDRTPKIEPALIARLPEALRRSQEIFALTGGLHGAAVFNARGELIVMREDIGRHNAVDKCVGFLLLREMLPMQSGILMVSGRSSFEIVQKALLAGIQTVAAVSAPSSLAVTLARISRMGLVGFVRDGSLNVYAGDLAGP